MTEREVIRCAECKLNQFQTVSGLCRRCKFDMRPKPAQPEPVIEEAAAVASPSVAIKAGYDIGAALRWLRLAARLSQSQLATQLGIPRTYISKTELGHVEPKPANIARFAGALSITPYRFMRFAQLFAEAQRSA